MYQIHLFSEIFSGLMRHTGKTDTEVAIKVNFMLCFMK